MGSDQKIAKDGSDDHTSWLANPLDSIMSFSKIIQNYSNYKSLEEKNKFVFICQLRFTSLKGIYWFHENFEPRFITFNGPYELENPSKEKVKYHNIVFFLKGLLCIHIS